MMANEFPYELPEGWKWRQLGRLGEWSGGGTPSKSNPEFWNGDMPWVSPKDMKEPYITDSEDHITDAAIAGGRSVVPPGSILMVVRSGILRHTFPVAVNEVPVTINQDLKALTPVPEVSAEWLLKALQRFGRDILYQCSKDGTTVQSIETGKLVDFPIPVAPPESQRRIVEKIEEMFSQLDAGVQALEKAQVLLKRCRQSVLKAAVAGKLTEAWREEHKDEIEPASVLLERILAERRAKWEADQLAAYEAKGKKPPRGWRERYREPVETEKSGLTKLPDEWVWASIQAIASDTSRSICAGPFGTIFKARDFRPEGFPIIFLRHVKPDHFKTEKPTFMDREKWVELFQEYSVYGGELLVTKLGDPPGECAIYPEGVGPAMLTPDVMKLEVDLGIADRRYVMHYLNSTVARRFAFGVAFGTTRLRLTLPIFRSLPIPLPPLREQCEIVSEIDRLLSICANQEESLGHDLVKSMSVRQSILNHAFAGKLRLGE